MVVVVRWRHHQACLLLLEQDLCFLFLSFLFLFPLLGSKAISLLSFVIGWILFFPSPSLLEGAFCVG